MEDKKVDCVVIGGGPAGLTAGLYLLRSGVSMVLVEKFSSGGQVLNTEKIENYPGFPEGILGYELADRLEKHLTIYNPSKILDEVKGIEIGKDYHKVILGERSIETRTIIICSGATHKKIGIPGEAEFAGKGISYCAVCDGNFFRNQEVVCIGGGNTALEEALYLSSIVKKVYLVHRRDSFRGDKIYQEKVFSNPKIEVVLSHIPLRIEGDEESGVTGIVLKDLKSDKEVKLSINGVFIFVGLTPQTYFVPKAIDKDEAGFIITDTEMKTNVSGIFAAGDVRAKRCRQVATAVGDGATAAHSAYLYLESST